MIEGLDSGSVSRVFLLEEDLARLLWNERVNGLAVCSAQNQTDVEYFR